MLLIEEIIMDKFFKHSVKAIIIKDGKLLVESVDYGRGRYCKLPGGGQEFGETMQETIIRECMEELNLEVKSFFPNLVMVANRTVMSKKSNG